jgi:outer membrane protein assembly factor BamB
MRDEMKASRRVGRVIAGVLVLCCIGSAGVAAAEAALDREPGVATWSRFRGPNGSGVSRDGNPPVELGSGNLLWRTELPAGDSSPVIFGDRIYLTAADGDDLVTLALDLQSGRELWRRAAPRPRREKIDNRNGPAGPSVATDGERVFTFFGDYGLLAYDRDGKELWRKPLGPFNNLYGVGASPILAGDRLILVVDQHDGSFLLAVDPATGEQAWLRPRPEAKTGHSTPVLHQPAGGELQIVLPGSFFLTGYSARTGEKLWWTSGLSFEMKSTPAIEDGVLFINGYGSPFNEEGRFVTVSSFAEIIEQHDADRDGRIEPEEAPEGVVREWLGFMDLDADGGLDAGEWTYLQDALASRNGLLAVKLPAAGERGDLTTRNVRWTYHRKIPQLPSPVAWSGVVLMVDDSGITTTLRAETGEVISQGRLEGVVDSFYASPVAAAGRFYLLSRSGKLAVLPADGSLEMLALSDLDDLANATPAIAGDVIYVRTRSALQAFRR